MAGGRRRHRGQARRWSGCGDGQMALGLLGVPSPGSRAPQRSLPTVAWRRGRLGPGALAAPWTVRQRPSPQGTGLPSCLCRATGDSQAGASREGSCTERGAGSRACGPHVDTKAGSLCMSEMNVHIRKCNAGGGGHLGTQLAEPLTRFQLSLWPQGPGVEPALGSLPGGKPGSPSLAPPACVPLSLYLPVK